MGNKSTIETVLSAEDREELNRKIGAGSWTIDELLEWLNALDYEISRSSLGRHTSKINDIGKKLRESREITEALVSELGDSATQGKQGRLLVEMTRNIVFDLLVKIQDEKLDIDSKDVAMLGKGLAELGRALRLDQDFEERIRTQIEKEVRESAASSVEKIGREKGISQDTIDAIVNGALGRVNE